MQSIVFLQMSDRLEFFLNKQLPVRAELIKLAFRTCFTVVVSLFVTTRKIIENNVEYIYSKHLSRAFVTRMYTSNWIVKLCQRSEKCQCRKSS